MVSIRITRAIIIILSIKNRSLRIKGPSTKQRILLKKIKINKSTLEDIIENGFGKSILLQGCKIVKKNNRI